jgi:hypothetical protein
MVIRGKLTHLKAAIIMAPHFPNRGRECDENGMTGRTSSASTHDSETLMELQPERGQAGRITDINRKGYAQRCVINLAIS